MTAYQIKWTSSQDGRFRFALIKFQRDYLVEQERATVWKRRAAAEDHMRDFAAHFRGGTCEIVEVN